MDYIYLLCEHSLSFSFLGVTTESELTQRICHSWCYLGLNPEPQDYEASTVTTELPQPLTAGRLADEKSPSDCESVPELWVLVTKRMGVHTLSGQLLKMTAYFCENCIVGCAHYFINTSRDTTVEPRPVSSYLTSVTLVEKSVLSTESCSNDWPTTLEITVNSFYSIWRWSS